MTTPDDLHTPIMVTAYKAEVNSRVGLRLNADARHGHLWVTAVAPDSIFAHTTELQPGMRVLSINGMDTTDDITAEEATGLIKRIQGDLTLEVVAPPPPPPPTPEPEPVVVTVTRHKPRRDTELGLRLAFHAREERVVIGRIAPDSIFADSDLTEGMSVSRINGMDVRGLSAEHATDLARRVRGDMTIVAETTPTPRQPPPTETAGVETASLGGPSSPSVDSTAVASSSSSTSAAVRTIRVVKRHVGQKLGMSIQRRQDPDATGMVMMTMITRVDPNGLLGQRGVRPGMRLVNVNQVAVRDLAEDTVRTMLARVQGELVLDVMTPQDEREEEDDGGRYGGEPEIALPPALGPPVAEVVTDGQGNGSTGSASSSPHDDPRHDHHHYHRRQQDHQPQGRQPDPHGTVHAVAYRPSLDTRIGVRLKCRTNGTVCIEGVQRDGLFGSSDLRTGMTLRSVNGVPVRGRSHRDVVTLIGQTVGDLRLVACVDERDVTPSY